MLVFFDAGNHITRAWNVLPRIVCAAGVEQRGIPRVDIMIRAMVIRGGANRTEGKKVNVILLSAGARKSSVRARFHRSLDFVRLMWIGHHKVLKGVH